jgi:hypothetical protein
MVGDKMYGGVITYMRLSCNYICIEMQHVGSSNGTD